MRTVGLVESPVQLLNVVEWADQAQCSSSDLTVIVLAPTGERSRRQLRATSALAREAGVVVVWHEPRLGGAAAARTVRALSSELAGARRLVVGDPFSGVIQVVLSVTRVAEVVIVDDGTATMEFARQWDSGEHLARWHAREAVGQPPVARFARQQIVASVRRRLAAESGCRLSVFTCLPVSFTGVPVVRNTYGWTRRQFPAPRLKEEADLIGTSLVETGVVEEQAYLDGVASLISQHRVDRYFAHRKESDAKLERIAALGVTVVRPELPLEVVARAGVMGQRVISFPSTVVHSLPLVLADTSCEVAVCAVSGGWLVPGASRRSESFLAEVTTTARDRYQLGAVTA